MPEPLGGNCAVLPYIKKYMQEEYPMQFRFRCAAVLTAVLLCSVAALPALAEEIATPETADSVSTYTGWKTVNGKDYWY